MVGSEQMHLLAAIQWNELPAQNRNQDDNEQVYSQSALHSNSTRLNG